MVENIIKTMENKQTAVEWLLQQMDLETISKYDKQLVEAKAMEKEQIEESFKHGRLPIMLGSFQAKDYYKQTYGK